MPCTAFQAIFAMYDEVMGLASIIAVVLFVDWWECTVVSSYELGCDIV